MLKLLFYLCLHQALALEIVMPAGDGSEVSIHRGNDCRPFREGERRQFNMPYHRSPSGVQAKYTLTKAAEKSYVIDLNVVFAADGDYDGVRHGVAPGSRSSTLDDQVDPLYRKKMQACFESMKGKIKDPQGNSFDFQIPPEMFDRTRFTRTADLLVISISNKNHRSHSEKYESDIDCPTMIHEVLHLVGLCDEYQERSTSLLSDEEAKKRGFDATQAAAYDCRKVGSDNSIMNDQYKALEDYYVVDFAACECETTLNCPMDIIEGDSCPEGTKISIGVQRDQKMTESSLNTILGYILDVGYVPLIIRKDKKPKAESLLTQEQANAILLPECEAQNKAYYDCAKDAYRTSEARGGQGCQGPAHCRDRNRP